MMTKKQFEMVAGVLRQQVDCARDIRGIEEATGEGFAVSTAMATTLSTTAYNLVQKFYAENPRFDHRKFYAWAGFEVEGNYPLVFPNKP